jgi:hypothetical protein
MCKHIAYCIFHTGTTYRAYCIFHIAYSILHIAYRNFPYSILHFAYCILHFAYSILHISYCILHIAYCILHIAQAPRDEVRTLACTCMAVWLYGCMAVWLYGRSRRIQHGVAETDCCMLYSIQHTAYSLGFQSSFQQFKSILNFQFFNEVFVVKFSFHSLVHRI